MARSVNKVTLVGNLGADPEIRVTTGGTKVATFSLATSRSWTNAAGEKQEKTEWHRCVVWNGKHSGLADVVEKYVKKGDKLYLEGALEYRQWTDKENKTRYSTDIKIRELVMLGGARGDREPTASRPASTPRSSQAPAPARTAARPQAPIDDEWADFPPAPRASASRPEAPVARPQAPLDDEFPDFPPAPVRRSPAPPAGSRAPTAPARRATPHDDFPDFPAGIDPDDDDLPF